MLVECATCGTLLETFDDDDPMSEVKAIKVYSLHQLEVHPQLAFEDSVVQLYVQTVAAWLAPRNGVLTKNRG